MFLTRHYFYTLPQIDLDFDLHESASRIKSTLTLKRALADSAPLILDGHTSLKLLSITLDGHALSEGPGGYERAGELLRGASLPRGGGILR